MKKSVLCTVLLCSVLTLLLAPLMASAQSKEKIWVTMGQDAFDILTQHRGILSIPVAPQAFAAQNDVVITQLPVADLPQISALMHEKAHRCAGFVAHGSFGEAQTSMAAAGTTGYAALAAPFTIDQQSTVNPLLPNVQESNILSTINHLSTSYNNRYYQNASGQQSALWIRDLWQGYAADRPDVTVTTYTHSGYVQPSVILTIPGSSLASEVVVLGGHLDSIVGGGVGTNTLAPGADDNASGIAALSEAIRVLLANGFTPDRTVKFMGYAAEEVGLRGSGDIASDHQSAGTNVVAVMQLDMTAFNGSAEDIAFIDDYTNVDLTSFTIDLVNEYQPTLNWTYSTCGYGCSDHASWHNRGYPAVMPFEARFGQHNQQIHTGNDTVSTFGNNANHSVKFSKLAISFAVETAMGGCTPTATADAGVDRTICAGDSVQIGTSAQAGHSYSWNPGGATSALWTVSPSATTTYTVTASTACGSAQDSVLVTVDSGSSGGLNETFEGGLGAWTTSGLWHLTNNSSCASPGYSSPTGAIYYGQDSGCTYNTGGATTGDLVSPVIQGINSNSALSFDYFRQVESYNGDYDRTIVSVKATSSSTWTDVWSRNSSNASGNAWTSSGNISLSSFAGSDVQVRFRFDSRDGQSNGFTGWFIDDVVVTADSSCGGGPTNSAPSVSISAPSNGASYNAGDSVTFSGSANDTEDGNLGGSIAWNSSVDGSIGSGSSFSTSGLSVGSHTITASVTDSGGLSDSAQVSITVNSVGGGCTVEEDFESGAGGWFASSASTCSTGTFIRGNPTQTTSTVTIQLGNDHNPGTSSGNAFFTAANSSAGNADVDGGNCIGESPIYAVSQASDVSIWYFHGQRDAGDDSNGDFFRLEISTDGGSSWSTLASYGDVRVSASWTEATATVPAGSNVKFRVQASDGPGPGDLIEAGIDNVSICAQ